MGFCSLQHLRNPRSTLRGLSLPATFRLQGLATLLTAYSLESRAGFLSHRRRSWDSPFGGFPFQEVSPAFSTGTSPRTVGLSGFSAAEASDRPDKTAVSGFIPPGSALRPFGGLDRQSPAPPMGFAPLGPPAKALTRISPDLLSHASRILAIAHRIRRRLRVSLNPCLASPEYTPECDPAEAALMGFLHQSDPDHSNAADARAICFTSRRAVHCCRLASVP